MTRHEEKWDRLLKSITFDRPDRMPVRGGCFSQAGVEAITGRNDYLEHPKEVYAEAMRRWDVDTVHQFVLPGRLDREVGPRAEVDVTPLMSCVWPMLSDWQKTQKIDTPERFVEFIDACIPDPGHINEYVDPEVIAASWIALDSWGEFLDPAVWIPGHLAGTVGWMWYGAIGYPPFLMAHALYPEKLERLYRFLGEEGRAKNAVIARVMAERRMFPMIYSGEDICDNRGPMCDPATLREIYFPHLHRALEPIFDAGIHWLWHSDGNILPIADDLLAIGIDGFQGFEEDKEMRLDLLLEKRTLSGNPPFICGSVSVTTTLYDSVEAVRRDKQRMQRIFDSQGGGVILGSSSSIMPDTPVEHILELYSCD